MDLEVKKRGTDVARHIQTVIERGDSNRAALGFLPRGAYFDAARQEKLLVAVIYQGGAEVYVGHLLFGGTFPHLRIFQVFVDEPFRRMGFASRLIDYLADDAEENGYLTVSARVADDLVQSNAFWERKGFDVSQATRGGPASTRIIHTRTRYLNTPTLFSRAGSSSDGAHDLRLTERTPSTSPIFSLDLNFLLDLSGKRARAPDAGRIIGAAMNNLIRLFVAQEFISELDRTHQPNVPDPILEFARSLPRFPDTPQCVADRLKLELANLIFPEGVKRGQLRLREQSDLMHLAAAIHNKAQGFVTSDQALLKRRALRAKYGIDTIGVSELAQLVCPDMTIPLADVAASAGGVEVQVSLMGDTNVPRAEEFLKEIGVLSTKIRDIVSAGAVSSPRRRYTASCEGKMVGFASWDSPQRIKEVDISIYADDNYQSARSAADYLLDVAVRDACLGGPAVLRLANLPAGASIVEVATARGFRRPQAGQFVRSDILKKIAIGQVIGQANFQAIRSEVKRLVQVQLPQALPDFKDNVTPVLATDPNGVEIVLTIEELESLLGPVLFVLTGRPCAMVPIRRNYADELIRCRPQRGLFPRKEASLFSERVYYSDPRTVSVLTPGTLLMFYESMPDGGLGAAIACARVVRSGLAIDREIPAETRRRGVLEADDALGSGTRNLTYFDNLFVLSKPVPLQRLKELDCWDSSNLVTSKPISTKQFQLITKEGLPNAKLY
jgi:GNAT superfamily N-acetyltransferase